MINSGKFNGVRSDEGITKVIKYLEENNFGKGKINYRLRDWLISRQRYWGTPIPIIHCPTCGEVPVEENELPIVLPYDVDFKLGGESPLARNEKYINVKCPKCGTDAKRDPDTMDTFVDSSWYYLRYLDPKISTAVKNIQLCIFCMQDSSISFCVILILLTAMSRLQNLYIRVLSQKMALRCLSPRVML